jgi:hypothetical protein
MMINVSLCMVLGLHLSEDLGHVSVVCVEQFTMSLLCACFGVLVGSVSVCLHQCWFQFAKSVSVSVMLSVGFMYCSQELCVLVLSAWCYAQSKLLCLYYQFNNEYAY